jgi:site-specific recombinase XerD
MGANRTSEFNARQKRLRQNEASVYHRLEATIKDYLLWMISRGYSFQTAGIYEHILKRFSAFITRNQITWNDIFTAGTLEAFQSNPKNTRPSAAIKGLARYLFEHQKIPGPIVDDEKTLPEVYEAYLQYYAQSRQAGRSQMATIKRVLTAFNAYLQRTDIKLAAIKIEHIDTFLADLNGPHAPGTRRLYRSCFRGFLSYLYQQRGILHSNLAQLVTGPPVFAKAKPPQFLRPHEVRQLFDSLKFSSDRDLRDYAMVHLAYYLGLRPQEISRITLDDIAFEKAELTLRNRKNNREIILPVPEKALKAIAAYTIGGRAKSQHRNLFISLTAPYEPIKPATVSYYISTCMRKAGLTASAYWLRHTYAQNLLEAGVSIFEIKEMLGHDSIESSRKYLHVHVKLMREVLFDETI